MTKLTSVALATALIVSGASTMVMAQNGQPTGGEPPVAGGANGDPGAPGVNESSAPQTAGRGIGMTHHKVEKHHKYNREQ